MNQMKKTNPSKPFYNTFFKGNRLLFALVMLLQISSGFLQVGCSWVLGFVTDCMATGNLEGLTQCAIWTAIAILAAALLTWIHRRASARCTRRAMTQYKALAYRAITAKSISAFSRENTGRYLSALTNDIRTVEQQYLPYILQMAEQLFGLLLSLGVMLWYSPLLTLVLLGSCLLPLVVTIAMGGTYAKLEQQVSDVHEDFTGRIKDLISGFSVIKSFKAEKETEALFASASNGVEQKKEAQRRYSGVMDSLSIATAVAAQLGTFIAGAFMAIRGDITAGTVLMFVNLCNSVLNPISTVPTCWAGIQASRALIEKLAALTQENAAHQGEPMEPVLRDAITLENLTFGYEENKPVLKNVDLRLEQGKKYAIVGASGSGKSTLLNLLMGSHGNYDGSIRLDGRELRDVDPDSLYALMSLIGQNVFLFDATIRENISMFRSFPDQAVESAARGAGLLPVITTKGEDYRCGENGSGLSGGEKQRVSIARALLRETPVLMLDEATATLDNQTAFEVTDAILGLDGLTRIVVTHRLEEALLQQYDEIIVLRDGQITEQGTYQELMARTGYFYSLYNVTN